MTRTPIDPHVRSALKPLVDRVLSLDPADRASWLGDMGRECPTVAREIERILRHDGHLPSAAVAAVVPLVRRVLARLVPAAA